MSAGRSYLRRRPDWPDFQAARGFARGENMADYLRLEVLRRRLWCKNEWVTNPALSVAFETLPGRPISDVALRRQPTMERRKYVLARPDPPQSVDWGIHPLLQTWVAIKPSACRWSSTLRRLSRRDHCNLKMQRRTRKSQEAARYRDGGRMRSGFRERFAGFQARRISAQADDKKSMNATCGTTLGRHWVGIHRTCFRQIERQARCNFFGSPV